MIMIFWRRLIIPGLMLFSLTGCMGEKSPDELYKQVKQSIVLITYQDKPGNGTGFFIEGEKGVCTLLTASHVIQPSQQLNLTLNDNIIASTSNVQSFPNIDVAIINFNTSDGKECLYKSLKLGNSDKVKIQDTVYIFGYPNREGESQLKFQSPKGEVTSLDISHISYDAKTFKGMSGSPVINTFGEVIAIHQTTDYDIIKPGNKPVREDTFKWGSRINIYLEKMAKNTTEIPLTNITNNWKILLGLMLLVVVVVIVIKAWKNRNNSLKKKSKRYDEALAAYDKAIEFNPKSEYAWNNKGNSLYTLKRYDEALAAYDKAIEFNPKSEYAIENRKQLLKKIEGK